jgi:hypothetical protein
VLSRLLIYQYLRRRNDFRSEIVRFWACVHCIILTLRKHDPAVANRVSLNTPWTRKKKGPVLAEPLVDAHVPFDLF